MTWNILRRNGISGKPPFHSIHYVTVPGAVAGWDALHRKFGKLPFGDLMSPAIYYAAEGFPVQERMAGLWNQYGSRLASIPGFKETFLPDGTAPESG